MWGAIITVVKLCVGGWSSRSGELGVRAVCLIQQIYQEGVLWASSLWSTTRVTENSRPSAEKLAPYWCYSYLVNFRWGCEMSVRKVWGDVISKPMNSHLFILQIYIGWYLRYQALGIQDLCIQDRLYFPSPGKRWKTKTKEGEERGKLSGDGWRHKIITKAEGGGGEGLCNFMSQVMGKTHFIGFKRISWWKKYFNKGSSGNRMIFL